MAENKLDDFFRNKLEDFRQKPNTHIWDRISDGLDEKKQRGTQIRRMSWSAAASLLLIGVGMYWLMNNDNQKTPKLISANILPTFINPIQEEKQESRKSEIEEKSNNEFTHKESKEAQVVLIGSEVATTWPKENTTELDLGEKVNQVDYDISERISGSKPITLIAESDEINLKESISDEISPLKEDIIPDVGTVSPRVVVTVKLGEKPQEKKKKIDANKILKRLNDLRKGYELNTQASNRNKGNESN